jgi:hypothetical protein
MFDKFKDFLEGCILDLFGFLTAKKRKRHREEKILFRSQLMTLMEGCTSKEQFFNKVYAYISSLEGYHVISEFEVEDEGDEYYTMRYEDDKKYYLPCFFTVEVALLESAIRKNRIQIAIKE